MEQYNREYQKAVRYLCEEIQNGNIAVGDRLPTERVLAEKLKISRNSTREAVRSLENMGIIESRQGSGNYFTGNVSKKISEIIRLLILIKIVSQKEICDFRKTMEKSICLSIMEQPNLDVSALHKILDEPCNGIEDEIEKDRKFHYYLVWESKNRFWIELMNAVCDVYRDWVDMVLRTASDDIKDKLNASHLKIADALQQKDRSFCESAIDEHYKIIDNALSESKCQL